MDGYVPSTNTIDYIVNTMCLLGIVCTQASASDASALPIIRKLSWPTINELIESEILKIVYKSVSNQAPSYLTEMFVRLSYKERIS